MDSEFYEELYQDIDKFFELFNSLQDRGVMFESGEKSEDVAFYMYFPNAESENRFRKRRITIRRKKK